MKRFNIRLIHTSDKTKESGIEIFKNKMEVLRHEQR